MKLKLNLTILALGLSMFSSMANLSVHAENPTVYVKVSQQDVVANDEVYLDLYIGPVNDLYGFQLDIHTSLLEGALPFEPLSLTAPYALASESPFLTDTIYLNTFNTTTSYASLIVTRPIQETLGYTLTGITRLTRLSIKALAASEDLPSQLQVSDDLLKMNLGLTNITLKLTTGAGVKIGYDVGVADYVSPTILLTSPTYEVDLNSTIEILTYLQVSDDRSSLENLQIYVSSFHDITKVGEYIITILARDEFDNYAIKTLTLIVGDPYVNIVIRGATV
jgi:hypothetical protein